MCPSFEATRDEKDSTRGRARVLQEMVDGRLVGDGWRSPEVHDALDLCLACKACGSDCPTGIDMATYKVEALHQRYRRRLRPRSHYTLGALPRWLRLSPSARLAAWLLSSPLVQRLAKSAAGVDHRRRIPVPAAKSARQWVRRNRPAHPRPDVVIWTDTFTEHFTPDNARAAVAVLEAAGLTVELRGGEGLLRPDLGQHRAARRGPPRDAAHSRRAAPLRRARDPVLALEPSCLATLRADVAELLDDPRAAAVAAHTCTLAELLAGLDGWTPPDLTGVEVVAQPHCHHPACWGGRPTPRCSPAPAPRLTRVDGCCGLAGNFGVEQGHYEVSVAVAEAAPAPGRAGRRRGSAVVLADGFSCRTQLDDLAGVRSQHLAELFGRTRLAHEASRRWSGAGVREGERGRPIAHALRGRFDPATASR